MSEEEKDMGGLGRIGADGAPETEVGTSAGTEETAEMPRPEGSAGTDGDGGAEGAETGAAVDVKSKGRRRKVACAAVAVVLVAGLGVGAALASRVPSQPEASAATEPATTTAATTAAADEDEAPTIQLGVTADGWDAESSSPVIAHVTNDEGTVDFYHAYDANKAEALEVDEAGTYKVSFISPVNSDGSIYKVGDERAVEAEAPDAAPTTDAATGAATTGAASDATTATFEKVEAKDVTADDLNKVAEQVAEAVKKGDETLSGDTGAAVVQKVTDNAKANANADMAKVEETTAKAQETAKADESGAKVPSSTGKSNASSANKSTSTSTTSKTSGGSGSSGSSGSSGNSSSSGSSNSSGSGSNSSSNQQATTPQKKWVAEQGHWETTYEQVWVEKLVETRHERYYILQGGGTKIGPFDSRESLYNWVVQDSDNGGSGGSILDDSYSTYEDQGHYENQATGQKWVVDVEGHWE